MKHADIVLKSNAVFTGLTSHPFSGGIAIAGNRIIAVAEGSKIDDYIGQNTKVYQYSDQMIMPGFIDSHVHFFPGAIASSNYVVTEIALSGSEEECVQMVKDYAGNHPEMERILGMGWYPANWNDSALPTRKSLDKAIPEKPVYLICADGHTAWLNTKALEECGITADLAVSFGEICKDENGEPNGILKEAEACAPAIGMLMNFPVDVMMDIQLNFLKKIAKNGVTSVSDMTAFEITEETIELYLSLKGLETNELLTTRLHLYPSLGTVPDYEKVKELQQEICSDKLRISGLKQFVDGVTSTYTGFLLEPYSDCPGVCGSPNYPKEVYEKCVIEANRKGLGVRLHCIADGSVRLALDAFEASNAANDNQGNHIGIVNTIEHCENIHPDDIPRFAELGVIASVQPYHLILDSNEKISRIGLERCRFEWPFRSLLDSDARLAFGTDFPVVDFNPFPNIYAAVTRCDDNGRPTGANPNEKVYLAEALKAYTYGGACAYGREKELGTLEAGKLADVTVIDKNLFAIPETEIPNCSVVLTVMDGNIVFEI